METRAIVNGKYVHRLAWERAKNYNAIPKWARQTKVRKKILSIYIKAQLMNLRSGRRHEVDHIIPLYSKYICGLHVPENLQILKKEDNQEKSNNFIPYYEKNGKKRYISAGIEVKTQILCKSKRKIAGLPNPTKKNPLKLAKKVSKRRKIARKYPFAPRKK